MVSTLRSAAAVVRLLVPILMAAAACLDAVEARADQLTASWIDNSNGTAVTRLERRPQTATTFTAIADVAPGLTSYVDAAVAPGTTYCYRVLAYDAAGVSPYSAETCGHPSPPAGLSLAFTNPAPGATVRASATVSVNASGGTGYTYAVKADGAGIYTGTNPTFTWNTTIVTDGPHTLTATVTDASNGTATALVAVNVRNTSTAVGFTDGSGPNFAIGPGTPTMIKARHIVELRLAVDNLRAGTGLVAYAWTDPTLTVTSTMVKRVHFLDLRAALSGVCATAPGRCVAYTDPTLIPGHTVIKAAHLNELRANVLALR